MKHRSLTEDRGMEGGHAHRTAKCIALRVSARFYGSAASSSTVKRAPGADDSNPLTDGTGCKCAETGPGDRGLRLRPAGRYLISTLAPCSSRAALIFSASSRLTPSLTG